MNGDKRVYLSRTPVDKRLVIEQHGTFHEWIQPCSVSFLS